METFYSSSPSSAGATRLRELFAGPGVVRIAGAHSPLTARLAERAGFDGVWSSGLEISASQGVPDADILSMTELLEVAAGMSRSVRVPVVADGDTGYGNANNVAHMVRLYEAAGIAGVSIEDKLFPKMNSFIDGRQDLAPIGDFCGKVEAAKSAQQSPEFVVIARVEALIAGWGLDEALTRGEAYAAAGADAVLIHSKGKDPAEVLDFLSAWRLDVPIVVVPTTYHTVSAQELEAAGTKMIIYANQGLRASIPAVADAYSQILRAGRTSEIEDRIAPLSTIFDLQGMPAYQAGERRFCRGRDTTRALILRGEAGQEQLHPHSALAQTLRGLGIHAITDRSNPARAVPALTALTELAPSFTGRTIVAFAGSNPDPVALSEVVEAGTDVAMLSVGDAVEVASFSPQALAQFQRSAATGAPEEPLLIGEQVHQMQADGWSVEWARLA